MPTGGDFSQRVLVLAPFGRDAELLAGALTASGVTVLVVSSIDHFVESFRSGCGAVLLTEEALYSDRLHRIQAVVAEQPTWSETPFTVLTSRGQADERVRLTAQLMQPLRNATIIERPVRPSTIVQAIESALRDRRRQYEVRDAFEALRIVNADLERKVEARTAELVKKVSELEGFCYSVSHDMRTPLRSMVGHARILLEEEASRLSSAGAQGLERLASAALKMAHLIDDLLQYARLGTTEPRRELCDVTEIAKRVAKEICAERGKPEDCVTVAPGLTAYCDPRLMGLLLQNLIDNGLKYQIKGAIGSIQVGRDDDGRFFVRDDGIGFEPQFSSKIFKPFERLHRDVEYEGTGIGLANVQRIVELHGGEVKAVSDGLGKGATVYFTLSPR